MTRSYGFFDCGMIVDSEVLNLLAKKRCKDYDEQEFFDDEMSYVERLYERGEVDMMVNFTGDCLQIADNGEILWGSEEHYDYDTILYIPLRTGPASLFGGSFRDMDELVSQLKQEFGDALGSDFDFRSRIRFIVGIYYG